MSGARRRWRRIVLGEAGPVPALILAGVTLVITFIVIAGPRALAAAGDRAVAPSPRGRRPRSPCCPAAPRPASSSAWRPALPP